MVAAVLACSFAIDAYWLKALVILLGARIIAVPCFRAPGAVLHLLAILLHLFMLLLQVLLLCQHLQLVFLDHHLGEVVLARC